MNEEELTDGASPIRRRHKCEFAVFSCIRSGKLPSTLWKKGALTKRQVDHALKKMKEEGVIIKLSYAAWDTCVKRLPPKTRIPAQCVGARHTHEVGTKKSYTTRGHGIVATLEIPKLTGWENRKKILVKAGIKFERILQGQRISIGKINKIWLCKRSIVFYLGGLSFFAYSAKEAALNAVNFLLEHIKLLEVQLRIGSSGLKMGKGYKIKFSREHYSLIRNALAEQYNREKKKLHVYDERGLWMVIDNSFNLNEMDFLRAGSAIDESDFMKSYFNDLNKTRLTPSATLEGMRRNSEAIAQLTNVMDYYGKNITSHVKSVQALGEGVSKLTTTIANLEKRFDSMANRLEEIFDSSPKP